MCRGEVNELYKVAIVDDESDSIDCVVNCLNSYTKDYRVSFVVTKFSNGLDFIEEYQPVFDIVFMDIDMPHKNGLSAAKELRKVDSTVELVFCTYLAKYATRGYEVDALNYMLKPINYSAFKITMDRAIRNCEGKMQKEVLLPSSEGTLRLQLADLNYIAVFNHDIIYHTTHGEFKVYGTLRAIEKLLPKDQFIKCNRSMLVNLRNVTRIAKNFAYIGTERLDISRNRKKDFLDAFHELNFPSGVKSEG